MSVQAEVLTVVIGMGPDLDHNGHWPEALNRAAIRRFPAVQP